MQKFEFLQQTPSGRISNEPEERRREREEKKMPFIVATYVYASSQGKPTHSARTKILKYCPNILFLFPSSYYNCVKYNIMPKQSTIRRS